MFCLPVEEKYIRTCMKVIEGGRGKLMYWGIGGVGVGWWEVEQEEYNVFVVVWE